jgi:phosphotransferase system enzyme I (PtsI)
VGPAFVVAPPPGGEPAEGSGSADEERKRLADALARAAAQLENLAERVGGEAGDEAAGIFVAQAAFASDPELARRAEEAIAAGAAAEVAVTRAFTSFRELLAGSASEYLAARVADLDDVRDRVLRLLRGGDAGTEIPAEPSVIVAAELTPSQTAELPRDRVLAFATERGAPASHAAVLARALGVPAAVGVSGLIEAVTPGVEVAVDGSSGEVVIEPDEKTRERYLHRGEEAKARREALARFRGEPGRTADGRPVELAANIGSLEDLEAAVEAGAEGCGLVRTEFLFIGREDPPSVEEQTKAYRRVLHAFPRHRVVFRTLDAGADKPLAFVSRRGEPNPALGVRGIRLSLRSRELFTGQLRALLRAGETSPGRTAVMFPMVSSRPELEQAMGVLAEAAEEEGIEPAVLEVGAMVEVPSAVLGVSRLVERAGFVSVGTNDLLQYLFAVDRLLPELADLPDLLDPVVLSLLGEMVEAAHAGGAWVGVCGEAAASPVEAAALVGLGVDELSMAPVAIPEVKAALRAASFKRLREAVGAACQMAFAADVRRLLTAVLSGG